MIIYFNINLHLVLTQKIRNTVTTELSTGQKINIFMWYVRQSSFVYFKLPEYGVLKRPKHVPIHHTIRHHQTYLSFSICCVHHNGIFHIKMSSSISSYSCSRVLRIIFDFRLLSVFYGFITNLNLLTLWDSWNTKFHFGHQGITQDSFTESRFSERLIKWPLLKRKVKHASMFWHEANSPLWMFFRTKGNQTTHVQILE